MEVILWFVYVAVIASLAAWFFIRNYFNKDDDVDPAETESVQD